MYPAANCADLASRAGTDRRDQLLLGSDSIPSRFVQLAGDDAMIVEQRVGEFPLAP